MIDIRRSRGCILSKFYIKPQHFDFEKRVNYSCILSKFYIKPQLIQTRFFSRVCCILSKFYIKPQPFPWFSVCHKVVSYRNSTSNHNAGSAGTPDVSLYLIEILHQTTTKNDVSKATHGCILSKFYIKPQLIDVVEYAFVVVSYRNSTSNHNGGSRYSDWLEVVSYRNSTSNHNRRLIRTSKFLVVSYRNSTSNHNVDGCAVLVLWLYLIEILHQTTTTGVSSNNKA